MNVLWFLTDVFFNCLINWYFEEVLTRCIFELIQMLDNNNHNHLGSNYTMGTAVYVLSVLKLLILFKLQSRFAPIDGTKNMSC